MTELEALQSLAGPKWTVSTDGDLIRADGPQVALEGESALDVLAAIYAVSALDGDAWQMQKVIARAALERVVRPR